MTKWRYQIRNRAGVYDLVTVSRDVKGVERMTQPKMVAFSRKALLAQIKRALDDAGSRRTYVDPEWVG